MLHLEGMTTTVGEFQLGPLDLTLHEGGRHVILGPSGSGKSTLLDLVVGFRRPVTGSMAWKARDLAVLAPEQRKVGYLPQGLALFPHLDVRRNIHFGIVGNRGDNHIEGLIDGLEIGHLLKRRPSQLSGGERQRVALARALAVSPDILVLDEPFSSLNEELRRHLWRILRDLQKERTFTLIHVTHSLEEALFLGTTLSVLIDGRIHQSDGLEIVMEHPATEDVARMLGYLNHFPAHVVDGGDGGAGVECPALGGKIPLTESSLNFPPGREVIVAIRPEWVVPVGRNDPPAEHLLPIDGRLEEIVDTGRGVMATFSTRAGGPHIRLITTQRELATWDREELLPALVLDRIRLIPRSD